MASAQKSRDLLTRRSVHTAVMNASGSKIYLKQIVPTAISFILHQRVELDETDFRTRSYGGIKYKVFKPTMTSSALQDVSNWIKGALDALEKDYLRELYLILESREEEGTIYESYKFQFKYMGNQTIPLEADTAVTKTELEESTNWLLTAVDSLNSHKLFKENEINIKMALTYYEDVTPLNYRPPYFGNGREDGTSVFQSLAKQEPSYVHLGILKTGYHIVKCRAKGDTFRVNQSLSSTTNTNEGFQQQQNPLLTSDEQEKAIEVNSDSVIVQNEVQNVSHLSIENSPASEDFFNLTNTNQIHGNFKCPCGIVNVVNFIDAVLCSKCTKFQHCACLGYLHRADIPNEYICPECDENKNNLNAGEKEKQQKISTVRLLVAVAYFTEEVPEDVLKMISKESAELMFKKLKEQKIIMEKNEKLQVNMKFIRNRILNALFTLNRVPVKKVIPDSMTLENVDMSQASSAILGGHLQDKKFMPK